MSGKVTSFVFFGSSLVLMIQMIIFIIKYCAFKYHGRYKVSIYSFILVILGSLTLCISGILYGIHYYLESPLHDIFDFGDTLCWHLSRIFINCYLLNRLYGDFKDTKYSISILTLCVLCLILAIYIIAGGVIIGKVTYEIIGNDFVIDDDERLFVMASLMIDFIMSMALLVIFIRKLSKNAQDIHTYYAARMDLPNMDSYQNSPNNMDTKDAIAGKATKIIILSIIMIILSQIVYVSIAIYFCIILGLDGDLIWFDTFYHFSIIIYIVFIPMILFMGFDFMNNWYKCCCRSCDKCVQDIIHTKLSRDFRLKTTSYQSLKTHSTINSSLNPQ